MPKCCILARVLIYCIVCEGCRGWEYPGEQVWRLQVETTAQMEALASLEADHRMDFWTEVRLCVWGGGGWPKTFYFVSVLQRHTALARKQNSKL